MSVYTNELLSFLYDVKSRKTLAHDIFDTFAKHSGLLSDVTDENYLPLNGSSHGHIF